MAESRTILIAGAGIGGLTAAIALAKRGFRVSVVEQAERLEAIADGICDCAHGRAVKQDAIEVLAEQRQQVSEGLGVK